MDRGISIDLEVLTPGTHPEFFFLKEHRARLGLLLFFSSFLKEILPLNILVKPGNNEEKKPHYK